MKAFKRILAIVLTVVMMAAMIPATTVSAAYDDTANVVQVIECSSQEHGPASALFDHCYAADNSSKWCINYSGSAYVIFSYAKPTAITGYTIVTGNDTAGYGEGDRNPKTWKLYGYNETEAKWDEVDVVSDGLLPKANNTAVHFSLDSASAAYSKWKWEITAIVNGGCMQASELILDRVLGDKEPQFVEGTDGKWGVPANMVDGLTNSAHNSKWCVDWNAVGGSANVVWKYNTAMSISSYTLITGNDTNQNPGRNPEDWKLYGSNDGSDWKEIDKRVGDQTLEAVTLGEYTFYLAEPSAAYTYFKLEITKIRDGGCMQLAEIILNEAQDQTVDFYGYQVSKTTTPSYDVRFVSTVDSLDFDAAGYEMTVTYNGNTNAEPYVHTTKTVYEKILGTADGVEEEYTAAELGGTYIVALTVTGISATAGDVTVVIKPFTEVDGVKTYGYTYELVLNAGAEVSFHRIAD